MALDDKQRAFLEAHPSAAMITVGTDGQAKPARVGVAVVDGQIWSSGTRDRARTRRLRRDPRCTLFVRGEGFPWLGIESTVTILDGPDAPELNVKPFRVMLQQRPTGPLSWFGGQMEEPAFLESMAAEGRLIYQFEATRAYGMV